MRRALFLLPALLAWGVLLGSAGCSSRGDLSTSDSQLRFGVRMAQQDLWREAHFRFQRAVQIDPGNAMARNNLAVALEGMGDFEGAKAAYLEALRLDGGNQFIQKNYSRFMEFYSRNEKRDKPAPSPASVQAAPAAATPAAPAPPPEPETIEPLAPPPAQTPPPTPPPTAPPPPAQGE